MIPVIDKEKCTGCGSCAEVCPPQAISLKEVGARDPTYPLCAVINEQLCEECGECVAECPEKAITLPSMRRES